ncbi:MAG: Ig-like domain-containing protein [Candidatus Sericytochromatia bacterium]
MRKATSFPYLLLCLWPLLSCSPNIPYSGLERGAGGLVSGHGQASKVTEVQKNTPPIIQNLTANPTAKVAAEDKISFTVEATDAEKDALKYFWSSDSGQLSATEGYSVFWQPSKGKSGVATISLTVSDGKSGECQAFVKLAVEASGAAQVGLISRLSCASGSGVREELYRNEGL